MNKDLSCLKIISFLQVLSHQRLREIQSDLNNVEENIRRFNENRQYLIEEEDISTKKIHDLLELMEQTLDCITDITTQNAQIDVDIAADVLAALYPDMDPRQILIERNILNAFGEGEITGNEVAIEQDGANPHFSGRHATSFIDGEVSSVGEEDDQVVSPIPEDPVHGAIPYERQRSRWRRILRTALPIQVFL